MSTTVWLLLFLTCLPCVITAEMSFTATPSAIHEFVTDQLLMRCALPVDSATSSIALSSIVISRNNADIAIISASTPAKGLGSTNGLQASGLLSANGPELGYLELSWNNPGADQRGTYTCDINGLDQYGHPVTVRKTIDVINIEATTRDLMKYVQAIQTTSQQQANIIDAMNNTIHNLYKEDNVNKATIAIMNDLLQKNTATIDKMNDTINDLHNNNNCCGNSKDPASITTMTSAINDNSVNINKLTTRLNTIVIFTAGMSSDVHLSSGHTLKFNRVIFSVGGGYNPYTGVFTCPVAGIYLFHLHVSTQSDHEVDVSIRHNRGQVVTSHADDRFDHQVSSNSVTLKLAVGDTVDVVTRDDSYPNGEPIPLTTFTGQLVAVE